MSTGRIIGIVILVVGVLVFAYAIINTIQVIEGRNEALSHGYNDPYYNPVRLDNIFLYFVGVTLVITGNIIIKKTKQNNPKN